MAFDAHERGSDRGRDRSDHHAAEQQHVDARRDRRPQQRLQPAHERRGQDDQRRDGASDKQSHGESLPRRSAEGAQAGTGYNPPRMSRTRGLAALVVLYLFLAYLVPIPAGITPQGWRQTAIFICVIAGMVTEPIHASALVLVGLTAMAINGTPVREVLGGFAEPSVWLVLVAMMIAKMMLDCGLARRIALLFVRLVAKTSLGVSYALQMTDVTLASGVPSITARSAGMVLPIGRSIAELFDSRPGPTANRLGAFLIAAMYQGSAVACAMFLTGQASNLLGADLALKLANVEVTWASWFVAAIVPGLLSCAVVPWIAYRILKPEVTSTPEAPLFAAGELKK